MKDELGRRLLIEFVALRPKAHRYLRNDNEEYGGEKNKKTHKQKCVVKRKRKFYDSGTLFRRNVTGKQTKPTRNN